ncbi:Ribosomal protein L10/acidic P0 [Penicillium cf. griseofulvum]|nr:Ribosomal protein L10/acidic P0 [Penicillium cf. griseofulvum]
MGGKSATKTAYFEKLRTLLNEYSTIFIVGVDNVSSQQMHEIRISLRGEAVVLMGKNTMVRRALKGFVTENPEWERLLPHVRGNVGFIFTNGDLKSTKEKILANRVAAPARAGAVAPDDVWIPAGNTGMEPGKTAFFQALGVPTKIARGTIEIVSDLKLVEAGNKVGASEATLLNLLNISPFTYGMAITQVYENGQCFGADILDITDEQLLKAFSQAIATITAVLAAAVATDYSWAEIADLKDRIANPDAYAAAAPAAAAAATSGGDAPAAAAPAEDEEESDEDMGFGLFD